MIDSRTLLITEAVDWMGGKPTPWRCFKTLLSRWSCKWDDQWAIAALVRWIFCRYRDKIGSTITFLSCWHEHSNDPERLAGAENTQEGGCRTLESLEKTAWWRVRNNSCGTKTPHEKSQRPTCLAVFWFNFYCKPSLFSVYFFTCANSTMMGELAFLATALETAVSELHRWLEDTMHSSTINNLYSYLRSRHKMKVWVLSFLHQYLKM